MTKKELAKMSKEVEQDMYDWMIASRLAQSTLEENYYIDLAVVAEDYLATLEFRRLRAKK